MTEAVLGSRPVTDLPVSNPLAEGLAAAQPAELASVPGSRLREYIRSGKFSPEVAAQLDKVMNAENAQAIALSVTAPPNEDYFLEMLGNSAVATVLVILALGTVSLSLWLAGVIDTHMPVVAALIFSVLLMAVVVVGSLNQAPPKPRPAKPAKKEKAPKPAKTEAKAVEPTPSAP
jgi:hypothetical protein